MDWPFANAARKYRAKRGMRMNSVIKLLDQIGDNSIINAHFASIVSFTNTSFFCKSGQNMLQANQYMIYQYRRLLLKTISNMHIK